MPNSQFSIRPLLAAVALVSLLVPGASTAAPSTRTISFACDFQPPKLEVADRYTRVTTADCDTLQRVGEPTLPFRTVRLLLPPDSDVLALEVSLDLGEAELPGAWLVEPGRAPVHTPIPGEPTAPPPPDTPDPAIYLSASPYPAARAELASIQRLAGFDIAFVRVFPLLHRPLLGQLTFAPRVRFDLSLAPRVESRVARPQSRAQASARPCVAALVENPSALAAYAAKDDAPLQSKGVESTFDYLLITSSNLLSAFQPLVNQKMADGLAVMVESVENITTAHPGRDAPEKIRNYIRYAYTNWGIAYVLLGGDTSVVPCRYAHGYVSAKTYQIPCDLYFACLDGSWNRDNDGLFGEPTDGETGGDVDLLAEVFVGRAPVETVSEVGTFVEKSLRYQTQPHPHSTNALFLAEYLGGSAQGGDMFDPVVPLFGQYHLSWLDDRPYTTPQWTRADALNALNASPHLAAFNGHGTEEILIGANNYFVRAIETPDLDLLTNQWPFLAVSVGCDVGQFDNLEEFYLPDCIGEELVKRHSRGAFAAILNSRFGWYDPQNEAKYSGEFQQQFFAQLLAAGQTNLGSANQLSKHDMLGHVESSGNMTYRFCYYQITLFGDPHLPWKLPPALPCSRQLVVASVHGQASPPQGASTWADGSQVIAAVTNSPLPASPGTQFVCTGWSGQGSVPAAGSSVQVTFTITNDSHITWNWTTQLWLAASVSGNGMLDVPSGWHDAGTQLSIQASPATYYHFVRWSGDVPAGGESNATIEVAMDRPRALCASFAENVTSHGTPEWWLASFGWTNQFETAAAADADHDGMPACQEYVAGTSPTDPSSSFRLTATAAVPACILQWPSTTGRTYAVFRAENLGDSFALLTNGLPATPPNNVFSDTVPVATMYFYRVEVRLPP